MKKTLLALALAGIATASFGFTVYSNDVASLTLSSSLKADFSYDVNKTNLEFNKLNKTVPYQKLVDTTKTPKANLSIGDLKFAGKFNLNTYETGFKLKVHVFDSYPFLKESKISQTVEIDGKSMDVKKQTDSKYEVYKFTNLSSTPFSIYFKSPKLGELTLGVNNDGIDLDGTDASTVYVDSGLGGNKYLVQYDSFKFFNGFTAGASLNFTSTKEGKVNTGLVSTYAGYVSYELPNSDVVKLTAVEGSDYSYNENAIRVLNNNVVSYQLAYINSSLVDNLTLEVAYAHSKSVSYDTKNLSADRVIDTSVSNNKNGVFFNANYTYNDYLNPYASIAYVHNKAIVENANVEHTVSGGVGLNSTLYSGYGVTVSSNLEADFVYSKETPSKANELSVATKTVNDFTASGYVKLEF